jgi:hypothetical protein
VEHLHQTLPDPSKLLQSPGHLAMYTSMDAGRCVHLIKDIGSAQALQDAWNRLLKEVRDDILFPVSCKLVTSSNSAGHASSKCSRVIASNVDSLMSLVYVNHSISCCSRKDP